MNDPLQLFLNHENWQDRLNISLVMEEKYKHLDTE